MKAKRFEVLTKARQRFHFWRLSYAKHCYHFSLYSRIASSGLKLR